MKPGGLKLRREKVKKEMTRGASMEKMGQKGVEHRGNWEGALLKMRRSGPDQSLCDTSAATSQGCPTTGGTKAS